MPKSRGRKQPKKNQKNSKNTAVSKRRPRYAVGRLKGSEAAIATLLDSDEASPDQLVELLLPLLWLYYADGLPGNHCVDGAMVLHYAYEQLGIVAQPRPVDLVVSNQRTDRRTWYGRPDPYWSGEVFNGHCVLWLPASARLLDATVEQYPEVRRYRLGPVIGRASCVGGGSPEQAAAMSRGELPDGATIAVQRKDLLLVYTAADPSYRDVVTAAPLVERTTERYRRAGINLASHALTLLRIPEIADKVRLAPYPRLHALLDAVGSAEFTTDLAGDIHFHLPVDGAEVSMRLDEIELPPNCAPAPRGGPVVPQLNPDPDQVQQIMEEVDTDARTVVTATEAMGGGAAPVVLFEPRRAVGIQMRGGPASEAQAEGIIAAGFARFTTSHDAAPFLGGWSVQRTPTGLELWDEGGIWARAKLDLDETWLATAAEHGRVQVVYGVRVGVRAPEQTLSYTDEDRDTELLASRRNGIAATAHVPWADSPLET